MLHSKHFGDSPVFQGTCQAAGDVISSRNLSSTFRVDSIFRARHSKRDIRNWDLVTRYFTNNEPQLLTNRNIFRALDDFNRLKDRIL